MARSRLKRHLQEQSLRNILLAIGGIIVVFVLIAMFGMDLLVNFSLLVRKSTNPNEIKKEELSYIAPPVLNPMLDATKSATIAVSGYAGDKQTIKLYVNGKLKNKTEVKKNKQFTFSNIKLEKGSNEIKAKAITDDEKESDYSSVVTITYIDKPPTLDISNPSEGQTFSKDNRSITVQGKTDEGVKVTVNDFWAISRDDGSFSYSLSLKDGDNTIKIVATDDADNQTTKEIKVKVE